MRISTFRTEHGNEVDFILELNRQVFAVELKASTNVGRTDLNGLKCFAEYYRKPHRSMVLYLGNTSRQIEGIDVLPWQTGLQRIGL